MLVNVRSSPLAPPLLETREATSIEIRDEQTTKLVRLLLFFPNKPIFIEASQDQSDFEEVVKNTGHQMYLKKD